MKTLLDRIPQRKCRKHFRPVRLDRRPGTQLRADAGETVQLIYAHLPRAVVLATEQHLRAQTRIEQRAQQLWFAGGCQPGQALQDWLQAEREVVRHLCVALQRENAPEPETTT